MTVRITCPECGKKLDAPGAVLGKKARCPGCKAVFIARDGDEEVQPRPRQGEDVPQRALKPRDAAEPPPRRPATPRKAAAPAAESGMKTPLLADETPVKDGAANMQRGLETVGGWLYLTDMRL